MLKNSLSRFLSGSRRQPLRKAGQRPLRLEMLEGREVPAGIVTAVQSGTTLILTGDTAANEIALTSNLDGTLNLSGVNLTTINGVLNPLSISGITNVRANLGAGNDVFTFFDAKISGSLTVDAGDGNDQVVLSGAANQVGSLSILGGVGDDSFSLSGNATIKGAASVNMGAGKSTVSIGTGFDNVTITGALAVSASGLGDSTVTIGGSSLNVGGTLGVTAGAGVNNVTIAADKVNVGGLVSLSSGAGADTIVVGGLSSFSSRGLTINTSAAGDKANITVSAGAKFNGNVNITTGAGLDTVSLAGVAVNGGNVALNLGDRKSVV